MDELGAEQEMSDLTVTVEGKLGSDQDTAILRLHKNRSTDHQLDTKCRQTWVSQT